MVAPDAVTWLCRVSYLIGCSAGGLSLEASGDEEDWMAGGVRPVDRPFGWWIGFDHGVEPEVVPAQGVDVGGQHPVVRTDLTCHRHQAVAEVTAVPLRR